MSDECFLSSTDISEEPDAEFMVRISSEECNEVFSATYLLPVAATNNASIVLLPMHRRGENGP
jgi:hypothetical protein